MSTPLTHGVFLDIDTVESGDLDRSRLEAALEHWEWYGDSEPGEIAGRVANAHAVLANKCRLDRALIEASPKLKLIALCATGTDNVDLQAASDHGVAVCNIRDYCTESVAQHAITLILNLLTGLPWYFQDVRAGKWSDAAQFCLKDRQIREARGLTLGIIGHGNLGGRTAELARALGMRVQIAERKGAQPREGRVSFEQVIASSDVISVHCPLTSETRGMIDRDVLAAMKKDALLINTARGAVVNAAHLAQALREGEIGGAGIDTLDVEPPPHDHALLAPDIPNLIVTPHNAWASRTARQAALNQLAQIVEAFQTGAPLNLVNGS